MGHRSQGTLTLPNGDQLNFNLDSSLNFDGKANPQDVTWPFDLSHVSRAAAARLSQRLTEISPGTSWRPERTIPKPPSDKIRVHRTFPSLEPLPPHL